MGLGKYEIYKKILDKLQSNEIKVMESLKSDVGSSLVSKMVDL